MATRLFVGNLPENTDENDLRNAFSDYGEVTNLELKCKPGETKKFAFITLSATNYDIESCIKDFSNQDYNGHRLHVTRARESFLERLQRERQLAQKKDTEKEEQPDVSKINPVINLGEKLNPRKRKFDNQSDTLNPVLNKERVFKNNKPSFDTIDGVDNKIPSSKLSEVDKKKLDSEKKRMESMKKKRQEFNQKKLIIKTGLTGIDKVSNKKVIFSDNEDDSPKELNGHGTKIVREKNNTLFDDEDSGDEVNFEIKKQYEGKQGQKVLDLQSRFKSDKRFTLDERFVEDDNEEETNDNENIELQQKDEKNKQLDILQDVLGVSIKRYVPDDDNKKRPKLGMLRFDPSQPEHAKFLAPVENVKPDTSKKSKKKLKDQQKVEVEQETPVEVNRPEVSKEQFYTVSETLKEAIAQPTTFSLRSLFTNNEPEQEPRTQDLDYIPLEAPKQKKVKNPLAPDEKNPFVYDSSDSETEDVIDDKAEPLPVVAEVKAVWKENLFFSNSDQRLKDGLIFFNINSEPGQKERRELKSLMKKRIYNKERKNQMFQKKIGGRKKSMKKSYIKKS